MGIAFSSDAVIAIGSVMVAGVVGDLLKRLRGLLMVVVTVVVVTVVVGVAKVETLLLR